MEIREYLLVKGNRLGKPNRSQGRFLCCFLGGGQGQVTGMVPAIPSYLGSSVAVLVYFRHLTSGVSDFYYVLYRGNEK